jgi:hypothetical protein
MVFGTYCHRQQRIGGQIVIDTRLLKPTLYVFECDHGKRCNFIADCPVCAKEEIDYLRAWIKEAENNATAPYGIIDPDYARVYTKARCTAWQYGYALMMHGSFTRDLDLLAVPWQDSACPPEHLIKVICYRTGLKPNGHPPTVKPHGRLAHTLMFDTPEDPRFIDISVMPVVKKGVD